MNSFKFALSIVITLAMPFCSIAVGSPGPFAPWGSLYDGRWPTDNHISGSPFAPLSSYELYGAWPADNNTSANLGVAQTDHILNPSNVSQLQPIFSTFTQGPGTGVDSTPTIADGNIYYATGGGMVYSYTEAGQLNWATRLTTTINTPEFFDESPVLTQQYLFIAGQQMHKLDRITGKEVVHPQPYDSRYATIMVNDVSASQLMVAGNLVIYGVGFANEQTGGESLYPDTIGEIIAFNQDNLSIAWRIEPSLVNGTKYGAGAGSFGQGGVDESRHLLFMGTSNEYEPPASPLSDSLLAIDYTTGRIVWSYQYAHGDYYGEGGAFLPLDGNHDLDVHGHPQIFSLEMIPGVRASSIDLVGARAKDGTYRIFLRDQLSNNNVEPLAQIQLDPATSADGGIQADPTINNGILYIASTSWVDPATPTVDSSDDLLEALAGANGTVTGAESVIFESTTRVRAIDLRQLVLYGTAQLQKGNKTPICVGNLNPSNRCTGQLPANIIKWETTLFPAAPSGSSGIAYDNGVLFVPTSIGLINMINASNGSILGQLTPAPLNPPEEGLSQIFVVGGVSIDNGKAFAPFGVYFEGEDLLVGGVTGFALPK